MGLMDREYMKRTPEERVADNSEAIAHQARQKEMYALFAKGDALTPKEKKRLEEIYELNSQYITNKERKTSSSNVTFRAKSTKKHTFIPILVFTLIILLFIFVLTYYPELLNL
ncbi:MAG: hypothetical protein Q4D16_21975 [Eubacteriales bacterium]|nr:hypothetical protein [Eubacteriales bacterium]